MTDIGQAALEETQAGITEVATDFQNASTITGIIGRETIHFAKNPSTLTTPLIIIIRVEVQQTTTMEFQ